MFRRHAGTPAIAQGHAHGRTKAAAREISPFGAGAY
jgi:hypothetical protein